MQLNSGSAKRRSLPLTPLIDVVFLLLVFFIVASTFTKFTVVPLETAGAGSGKVDPSKVLLIHLAAQSRLLINGVPTDISELRTRSQDMIAKGKSDAIIVPRRESSVADLAVVLATLNKLQLNSVRVVN